MFGNVGNVIKLLSDKDALAATVKAEIPSAITMLMAEIAKQCEAPEEGTAVVLFHAPTETKPTLMARVHFIGPLGDLGEELGTIDIAAALAAIPNSAITDKLPF